MGSPVVWGGGLPGLWSPTNKQDRGAHRTFQGLRKQVYYLLGRSSSKGPQHELSRYLLGFLSRGAVALWLVRSTPERALRVRDLAWDIVLCS